MDSQGVVVVVLYCSLKPDIETEYRNIISKTIGIKLRVATFWGDLPPLPPLEILGFTHVFGDF
jgi:hypothetical protein